MKRTTIYLDSQASTPVDQDVLQAMMPFFTQYYANGNHKAGWKAASAMEAARFEVANLIGARPSEIIFTSGATESINLGLMGLIRNYQGERRHIITQKTEHTAVLACFEALKKEGYRVSMLDVDAVGRIDLDALDRALDNNTLVVAIMLANNEIGTVQPVEKIGALCRAAGAKFFCDITQGLGWHPVDVDAMNIDLASMSSHKIYGPRGVGALFVRRKGLPVKLSPIMLGGKQEKALRPGTANIPGLVGFGKACSIMHSRSEEISAYVRALRDCLQGIIFEAFPEAILNGCSTNRHPGNLNIIIPFVDGEDLIGMLPHITFSTSSACTSASTKASHVIQAVADEEQDSRSSFRLGINKFNTIEEIEMAGAEIVEAAMELRARQADS